MGRIRRWFRNLLSDKSGEKDQIAIQVLIEKTPVAEAGPKRVRTILMVDDDDESVLSIGADIAPMIMPKQYWRGEQWGFCRNRLRWKHLKRSWMSAWHNRVLASYSYFSFKRRMK